MALLQSQLLDLHLQYIEKAREIQELSVQMNQGFYSALPLFPQQEEEEEEEEEDEEQQEQRMSELFETLVDSSSPLSFDPPPPPPPQFLSSVDSQQLDLMETNGSKVMNCQTGVFGPLKTEDPPIQIPYMNKVRMSSFFVECMGSYPFALEIMEDKSKPKPFNCALCFIPNGLRVRCTFASVTWIAESRVSKERAKYKAEFRFVPDSAKTNDQERPYRQWYSSASKALTRSMHTFRVLSSGPSATENGHSHRACNGRHTMGYTVDTYQRKLYELYPLHVRQIVDNFQKLYPDLFRETTASGGK